MLFFKRNDTRSDEQLMALVARKDERAFSELYDRYADKMMRYFYRMLGRDREKAADFTQDIFTKLIEKPHLYDVDKKFSTWLYAIASNMCKNEYRRLDVRKNTIRIEPDPNRSADTKQPDLHTTMDQKTFERLLHIELNLLDEKHRETFILRYQDELSIKEIAEILQISEGTVKSRLFYTSRKLAEKLRVFDLN